jgi:hypothetical protein
VYDGLAWGCGEVVWGRGGLRVKKVKRWKAIIIIIFAHIALLPPHLFALVPPKTLRPSPRPLEYAAGILTGP